MGSRVLRVVAGAMLVLAAVPIASGRTRIVVTPNPVYVTPNPYDFSSPSSYCATLCAPRYAIWNGRLSCGVRTCTCGCVHPNNAGPLPRFYELY